jgi:hypothetical protein
MGTPVMRPAFPPLLLRFRQLAIAGRVDWSLAHRQRVRGRDEAGRSVQGCATWKWAVAQLDLSNLHCCCKTRPYRGRKIGAPFSVASETASLRVWGPATRRLWRLSDDADRVSTFVVFT